MSAFFFSYSLLNRQSEEWGSHVSVVSCDMRAWGAPEKVHVCVCVCVCVAFMIIKCSNYSRK